MYSRLLEPHLVRLSQEYPVVTLTGPRQSGKTTLCRNTFSDYQYINLEDIDNRQFATDDPRGFLSQYQNGVILDEIQRAPDLPSYIQSKVDETDQPGQYILTGSQQFEVTNSVNQSLAGRTALLKLLPLSIVEAYQDRDQLEIDDLLYHGFYPRVLDKQLDPTEAYSFYFNTYVERDIRALQNIQDLSTFERFVKLCAGQIGQLVNYSSLANACGVDQKTIKAWLSLLEASFILFQLAPHHQNFKKRLTKSKKLYFYDIGLATYLLGVSEAKQLATHPSRGALFENMVISEAYKARFNAVREPDFYFFRDHVGNEVDLVFESNAGLTAVEIKSGLTLSQSQFKGLEMYKKISEDNCQSTLLIYGGHVERSQYNSEVVPYYKTGEVL